MSEWDGDERRAQRGWGVNFTSTIELGHIIQAGIMIVTLGGWALVGYQTIDRQLIQHQNDMALFRQRMKTDEDRLDQISQMQQTSSNDTRAALSKIIDQVADLRTLVASQGRDGARH